MEDFCKEKNVQKVPDGFSYNSYNNTEWLDVQTLRSLIIKFVDPNFTHE